MTTPRLLLACVLALSGCAAQATPEPLPPCPTDPPTANSAQAILTDADRAVVEIHSESGNIDGRLVIELYGEEAPLATANFVSLAECGFYDDISFHRVLAGFVAQAGDPQTKENRGDFAGLGTGGPPGDYRFEIESPAEGLNYDQYAVAMANAGQPNTNGSQFFINLADLDDRLPRDYTIFGRVVEGTELVDTIGQVPVNHAQVGVPLDPVIIDSIRVEAASGWSGRPMLAGVSCLERGAWFDPSSSHLIEHSSRRSSVAEPVAPAVAGWNRSARSVREHLARTPRLSRRGTLKYKGN